MKSTNLRPGYVSVLAVLSLTSVMLVMLASSFRFSLQSQEVQKATQLRIDYTNREQTLLRGTLNEVVNSAIRSMKADTNSADWQNELRWRWVFENARTLADGETALDGDVASVIGVTTATSGNLGDGGEDHIVNNIAATLEQASTHLFYVNSGTNSTATSLGSDYPEPLVFNDPSLELLDRDRPVITMAKTYADGSQYKLIPYPNVHFGYTTQGQNFVAKRNWWAFTVTYGKTSANQTGVQTVEKDYVLSIYEVPSQLAISSTSVTYLGTHADGSSWGDVSIAGGVFAEKAFADGMSLDLLSTRRGSSLENGAAVLDVTKDNFSGEVPTREKYEAENNAFYPISSAGDSGLVAFVPITQGIETFDDLSNTDDSNRASPTSWNWYSRPAMQCAMKVRIEDVVSATDQTPTRISFTYKSGGIDTTEYFSRGVNWPTADSNEGATFPFHLEDTSSSRPGIAVYVSRLADYLTSVSADSLEVNNSILINSNYVDNVDVAKPSIPSLPTDPSLIFRDAKDLTRFTKGFSLVTPYRLYLANDVNLTASGTDATGNSVYPPISLFAPEKRFGVRDQAINIDFEGQLNYVGKDSETTIRPLDLRSGVEEKVVSENIKARLHGISDPAQLPPINQMNWLVVIEEVR